MRTQRRETVVSWEMASLEESASQAVTRSRTFRNVGKGHGNWQHLHARHALDRTREGDRTSAAKGCCRTQRMRMK